MTVTKLNQTAGGMPWYKHRWPWILMAGPLVVIVAGLVTAGLAVKSWDGLVADDYYKQGLGVNQVKTRDQAAGQAGISAEVTRSGLMIQVALKSEHGAPSDEKLLLKLLHPTRNGQDQGVELQQGAPGMYRGFLGAEPEGRFNVQLENLNASWRLTGEWNLSSDKPLMLRAAVH